MSRLSVKQAAERAGVSESLIYQWTTVEKRLPHYRMGSRGKRGKLVIESDDLDAFVASLKVTPAEASAPASSGLPAEPFSELNPRRLARAWKG